MFSLELFMNSLYSCSRVALHLQRVSVIKYDYKIGLSAFSFIGMNWVNQRHAVYALYFIVTYSVYILACAGVNFVYVFVFVLHCSYVTGIGLPFGAVWLVSQQLTRNWQICLNAQYAVRCSPTLAFCHVFTRSVSRVC